MYLYETHLHTSPMSACAKVGIRETLEYYKSAGYAGVFLTNHFLDGNIDKEIRELPYAEKINRYFDCCEDAKQIGEEIGLKVFPGIEMGDKGCDFLVYGIDREWCLAHEEMHKLKKSELLTMMMEDGALIVHAHPFREAKYIDHIHLYPRHVHGVEIFNAGRPDFVNLMAEQYCKNYELIPFAGSDNHVAGDMEKFGGIATDEPIADVKHFIELVFAGKAKPFLRDENGVRLLVE